MYLSLSDESVPKHFSPKTALICSISGKRSASQGSIAGIHAVFRGLKSETYLEIVQISADSEMGHFGIASGHYHSSVSITLRPLYVPQLGHAW